MSRKVKAMVRAISRTECCEICAAITVIVLVLLPVCIGSDWVLQIMIRHGLKPPQSASEHVGMLGCIMLYEVLILLFILGLIAHMHDLCKKPGTCLDECGIFIGLLTACLLLYGLAYYLVLFETVRIHLTDSAFFLTFLEIEAIMCFAGLLFIFIVTCQKLYQCCSHSYSQVLEEVVIVDSHTC